MSRMAPSLVFTINLWSMKSKSMSKVRAPEGIGDEVSPRAVT